VGFCDLPIGGTKKISESLHPAISHQKIVDFVRAGFCDLLIGGHQKISKSLDPAISNQKKADAQGGILSLTFPHFPIYTLVFLFSRP